MTPVIWPIFHVGRHFQIEFLYAGDQSVFSSIEDKLIFPKLEKNKY